MQRVPVEARAGVDLATRRDVLVTHDMLGLFLGHRPKFVRSYAELGDAMRDAIGRYAADVKARRFPSDAESY